MNKREHESVELSTALSVLLVLATIGLGSSLGFLVNLSKRDGGYSYNTASVAMLSELTKMLLMAGMLWARGTLLEELRSFEWRLCIKFAIPGEASLSQARWHSPRSAAFQY